MIRSSLAACLAVFVILHDTAGNEVWIAPAHVVAVGLPFGHGPVLGSPPSAAGAKLTFLGGAFFYVKESPDAAVKVLENK